MKRLQIPVVLLAWLVPLASLSWAGPPQAGDGVSRLLSGLETALKSGDPGLYTELMSSTVDPRRARLFAESAVMAGATRVAVRERDRAPLVGTLPGDGYSLILEVFTEFGRQARLATWRVDIRRKGGTGSAAEWGILWQENLSSVQGLYRLALDPARQYAAHDLTIKAEDLELRLPEGSAFVAETDGGPTGLVLLGRGEMVFSPAPATERGQIRLVTGTDTLQTSFDGLFIRLNPSVFDRYVAADSLVERPVDPREFQRADELFREDAGKSFTLDLGDLSSETWSLLPGSADLLAEIHTRRYDTLTYARSSGEAEDVALFDRAKHRNLSIYSSAAKLAARGGRFYDEDQLVDYDIQHYEIDVNFDPARQWIDGRATLTLRVRAPLLNTFTLKLAETVTLKSVVVEQIGRVLALPVRNQNSVVVNLPVGLRRGDVVRLLVSYAGPVRPQPIDEVVPSRGPTVSESDEPPMPLESNYLYSNRSYWYPQSVVSDYATANIRITVPRNFGCVASGDPLPAAPVPAAEGERPTLTRYAFRADQPLRYLAFLVSRLVVARREMLRLDERNERDEAIGDAGEVVHPGVYYQSVRLSAESNPRQQSRVKRLAGSAADILRYYASLLGDFPYPSLTLALLERPLPGGHSPAFLATVSEPLPGTRFDWSRDPASFPDYPEFFIAHELAHQWWGQAIGWKNYHEQWLSEGLAQYFAALYAAKSRGPRVFEGIIRRFQEWSLQDSAEGPVYLGYRVGHIKGDSQVFRAIVYNKSGAVLHMLRRLIGDEAFFRGLRSFYLTWRYRKAGTDDLRVAFEAASHRPLTRFFERWIYDSGLPSIRFSWRVEEGAAGSELVVRFEQAGDIYDIPITVSVDYSDRPTATLVVPVTDRVVEKRMPLAGSLRRVEANRDQAALVNLRAGDRAAVEARR